MTSKLSFYQNIIYAKQHHCSQNISVFYFINTEGVRYLKRSIQAFFCVSTMIPELCYPLQNKLKPSARFSSVKSYFNKFLKG